MARKILIVDDNAINRQMLINTLEKDYEIIEAQNGVEALKLMHRYYKILSAVLLDIVMPEMDGYTVLKKVGENPLLSQIPIIMVTGSEDEESRVKVLSLGANDFILKPFNPEIVKHCIRNNIALRETASILNAIQKDKLTGLYNRESFFEKAKAMIADKPAGYFILSCFDIDNFKLINDQYGANEGDRILREVGAAVKANVEAIGGIGARISADNFAAIFPESEKDTDVLKRIDNKDLVMLDQWNIVFSIGRYLITDLSLPVSAVYDRAYLAKQSVKGRYDKHLAYFDETMLQKLVRDQQIAGDMEAAIAQRQFEVWFQPQYDHVTGYLSGAEALVRWRHPDEGIIPPGEFVPLFEQNGFVYELDKYVWEETCRYLRNWLDRGLDPLPVSVNFSRYDIFRTDLIDVIMGIINKYNIPIELLHIEITESAFAKSTNLIVEIVKQLIILGFTIEIDDFGSGYSSLNTLKSVPAQVIKLDMHFLDEGEDALRGGNILKSIVRMTKRLGMSVIAEGVETKEQGDFLRSIGCRHVQGYLYARPMPADEYEKHFKTAQKENKKKSDKLHSSASSPHWQTKSMDSIIFNSFAGSACIFDYQNGRIKLLRATEKYAKMLGENMSVQTLMSLPIMDYLDKKTSGETMKKIKEAVENKGEALGEFLFTNLPGCEPEVYIRSTMRTIARSEQRYLIYCNSENITAQKVSERNEKITASRLKSIMDNINCGITAISYKNEVISYLLYNDKFFELLGCTRESYISVYGKEAFAFAAPDERERALQIANDIIKSGKSGVMEYRALRADGNSIWLRSYVSMTDFEGEPEKVQLCTYVDISDERNTLQSLLDNLPCGVGLCSVKSTDEIYMNYVNKRFFAYFKNRNEIKGKCVYESVHPSDIPALKSAFLPALSNQGEGSCVARIKDGDACYVTFRISWAAVKYGGIENSIYVTFVPISDEELSFREMLPVVLEKVLTNTDDLSFVKDMNLRYICCSSGFAKMVGLSDTKQIVGKTDFDLFNEEMARGYIEDDKRLIKSGKSIVNLIEEIPEENGKIRYSSTSKYLLTNARGEMIGLYGTGRDVTGTREAAARQEFLINNIPGGIAVYEGQWSTLSSIKLTYFSDGFCSLFGYTREEYEVLGNKNPTGLVEPEFIPKLISKIEQLVENNIPLDFTYRAKHKSGKTLWINIKAVQGERHKENMTVNSVLFDVTEHQEALEKLRTSEEEYRLAVMHSSNTVCRYDIATKTLKAAGNTSMMGDIKLTQNVPEGPIADATISEETSAAYRSFFESIIKGEKNGSMLFQRKSSIGWRWIKANFSTIFSSDGKPVSAVISYFDITESLEKDVAYKKWIQALHNKDPLSYNLYRCNLSKNTVFESYEGALFSSREVIKGLSFSAVTKAYLKKTVYEEDKPNLKAFLNADSLIKAYYRGECVLSIEYRELLRAADKDTNQEEEVRWLRLSVELVEYPHPADVEAYLLFENIDEEKKLQLDTIERAETDPLTGILNRATFKRKVDEKLNTANEEVVQALLMIDLDGFKGVNDVFGHAAGDQVLIEVSQSLKELLRRADFIGRLGGDEFVVFLTDLPSREIAAKKAEQICLSMRKAFSDEVKISASVGIAIAPDDGTDFETLYKKVDEALYFVKETGRDNFVFYHEDLKNRSKTSPRKAKQSAIVKTAISDKKKRMLIVDDSKIDLTMLANLFCEEFEIERASDGVSALSRLKHYQSAISVVLLDLIMPNMDGFEVLSKMRDNPELASIPVVVVSVEDDIKVSLRAIKMGASDYVMKPINPDILKIRVYSAISKAENDKLRSKNSMLEMQSGETTRYRSVIEHLGLGVIEADWGSGTFSYSDNLSMMLTGTYDDRSLWHILLSDMVCPAQTVSELEQYIHRLASDRLRTEASISLDLKAKNGEMHQFYIIAYKLINEYGLTDKIIITLRDTDIDS